MKTEEDEIARWKALLGELVFSFSYIEYSIHEICKLNPSTKNSNKSREGFLERAAQSRKFISTSNVSLGLINKLDKQIEFAQSIANERNDFIHNPLNLSLKWLLREHDDIYSIKTAKKTKELTIKDLERLVKKTVSCADKLHLLSNSFVSRVTEEDGGIK